MTLSYSKQDGTHDEKGAVESLPVDVNIWRVLLWMQLAFTLILGIFLWRRSEGLEANEAIMVAMDILCVLIAILFYLSIFRSGNRQKDSELFMMLLTINMLYLGMDISWYFVEGIASLRALHIIVNVLYLLCPVGITLIYWNFLDVWVGRSKKYYAYTLIK